MSEILYHDKRQESFLERLEVVLSKQAQTEDVSCRPTRLLVLGHCIAAVENGYQGGECDIYFATAMWGPKNQVWGDYPYPPLLEAVGLGRIEGISSFPPLKELEVADGWVRSILTPNNPELELLEPGKYPIRELKAV